MKTYQGTKVCSKCQQVKPTVDFRAGHGQCKLCLAEYNRAYYAANREYIRERERVYYASNRAVNRENRKEYYKAQIANLGDVYIRSVICNRTDLKHSDIPDWLVELKREHLKLIRIKGR